MRRSLALACPLVLLLACGGSDSEAGGNAGGSGGNGNGSGNGGDGDGTGNGSGDGDGDGDGSSGGGGIIGCGDRAITPGRVTPDILVVLDRSTSMRMNNVNRWDPSVEGLNAIVGAMEDQVRFGLMTYPARSSGGGGGGGGGWGGGGWGGGGSCDPGQLDVPIEINNAAAIADMLDDTSPGGYTPTAATLEAVHDILGVQFNDGAATPRYVMLITDGAPNCMGGAGPGAGGGGLDPAAVDATVTAIEALAQEGIPTYVLGYDTQSDRDLSSALDRMAVAGATGDQQHRPIGDRASLEQEFAEITGNALTCDYLLAEEARNPASIVVQIAGQTIPRDDPNGWVLSQDGGRITLRGEPCERLKSGMVDKISFSISCEDEVHIID